MTPAPTVRVGQHWRDEDGYPMRVVAIREDGWPWMRHPNAKAPGAAMLTNPAWLRRWTMTRDAPGVVA